MIVFCFILFTFYFAFIYNLLMDLLEFFDNLDAMDEFGACLPGFVCLGSRFKFYPQPFEIIWFSVKNIMNKLSNDSGIYK